MKLSKRKNLANQGYGPKPSFDETSENKDRKQTLILALSWFNHFYDNKKGRSALKDWALNNMESFDEKAFDSGRDSVVHQTAGSMAQIIQSGWKANETETNQLINFVNRVINDGKLVLEKNDTFVGPKHTNPNELLNRKIRNTVLGHYEQIIDELANGNRHITLTHEKIMSDYNVKGRGLNIIKDWAKEKHQEYQDVLNNPEINDAYIILNSNIKRILRWLDEILKSKVDDTQVEKAINKPRKKSVAKSTTDNVKYLKHTDEFNGLTSLHPKDVIGKQVVITTNIRYNDIFILYADGPRGISFKGTKIVGIDLEKSIRLKCRKNTENFLKIVKEKNQKYIENSIDPRWKSKQEARPNMNQHIVIVRAF